jgi:hypothetical protein
MGHIVWHIAGKHIYMRINFQHHQQKITPFHLFAFIYAAIILAGLLYKFFKQSASIW